MSDDLDPLERELQELRPRQPSPQLHQRIDKRLKRRRLLWLALPFVLLLAGLLALPLLRQSEPTPAPVPPVPPAPVEEPAESLPTLQAYRRALQRSPEELDALLARHAAARSSATPVLAVRSNPDLILSNGGR